MSVKLPHSLLSPWHEAGRPLCFLLTALVTSAIVPQIQLQAKSPEALLPYVQPLVGTARPGQTIPAVGVPFGMTQLTPQTQTIERHGLAPYNYDDAALTGFRATHWISGSAMQDFGSVLSHADHRTAQDQALRLRRATAA